VKEEEKEEERKKLTNQMNIARQCAVQWVTTRNKTKAHDLLFIKIKRKITREKKSTRKPNQQQHPSWNICMNSRLFCSLFLFFCFFFVGNYHPLPLSPFHPELSFLVDRLSRTLKLYL